MGMVDYRTLANGGAVEHMEQHCRICRAVARYCPGHKFDLQWAKLRGGRLGSMMPPAPGNVISRRASRDRPARATGWGYFSGDPICRWNADGVRMHLLEEFTYTDRRCRPWSAPRGCVLDGASIPRAFWSLVGSPYRGRYRYASIVHDAYCVARDEPWPDVHYMFYEACMAAGTGHTHAKILYYAVRHFGPRWYHEESNREMGAAAGIKIMPEEWPEVLRVERWIVDNDPTPAEIAGTPPEAIGHSRNKPKRK